MLSQLLELSELSILELLEELSVQMLEELPVLEALLVLVLPRAGALKPGMVPDPMQS